MPQPRHCAQLRIDLHPKETKNKTFQPGGENLISHSFALAALKQPKESFKILFYSRRGHTYKPKPRPILLFIRSPYRLSSAPTTCFGRPIRLTSTKSATKIPLFLLLLLFLRDEEGNYKVNK